MSFSNYLNNSNDDEVINYINHRNGYLNNADTLALSNYITTTEKF